MTEREQLVMEASKFILENDLFLMRNEHKGTVPWIDSNKLYVAINIIRRLLSLLPKEGEVVVPVEPTEEMLIAARDWSAAKYNQCIGNDAATGCYKAMIEASLVTSSPALKTPRRNGHP